MSEQPEWLTLEGGEEIVWTGQPRTMSVARPALRAAVRTAVLLAVVWAFWSGFVDEQLPSLVPAVADLLPGVVLPAVAGLVVAWGVGQVAWAYLTVVNVDYVLTDRNVYKKTGVFSEHVTRVGVDRVQRTSQSKDVLGNLFDYGSVAVSTAGSGGVQMVVADVWEPDELRDELRRLVNRSGGGGGVSEASLRDLLAETRQLRETVTAVEEVLEG